MPQQPLFLNSRVCALILTARLSSHSAASLYLSSPLCALAAALRLNSYAMPRQRLYISPVTLCVRSRSVSPAESMPPADPTLLSLYGCHLGLPVSFLWISAFASFLTA